MPYSSYHRKSPIWNISTNSSSGIPGSGIGSGSGSGSDSGNGSGIGSGSGSSSGSGSGSGNGSGSGSAIDSGSGRGRGDCGDSGETAVNGYNSTLIWILSLSCLCLAKSIFT